jgi:hypothetical protein
MLRQDAFTNQILVALLSATFAATAACGGDASDGGGGTTDGSDASDATTMLPPQTDSGPSVTTTPDAATTMGDDTTSGGDADVSDASAMTDASVDAGASCMPATFPTDCPLVACQTASGCIANICQYSPQTPCLARALSGSFTSGGADVTNDAGVTLHGNISAFRSDDGVICVGITCLSGGITP